MRKWSVFVLLLGLTIFPLTAGAEGGTRLKSINIELWSEYDQPSMLVIHEFVLAESASLPTKVTLRFPKDGNLIAVAFQSAGSLINAQFSGPEAQGNWQTVTLTVDSYDPYRIEYYQPLTRDGNKRQFTFKWFGDYYVQKFDVNLLLPADSTGIVTSPALDSAGASSDGLNQVGSVSRGEMKMGKSFEFTLEYERTSDALANPGQSNPVQPSEPIGPNTPGRVSTDQLPWIIGGAGLALIVIALFTYWNSARSRERTSTRSGSRPRRQHAEKSSDGQVYCHECGTRAQAGDRFCRTCGSRLRIE